MTPCEQCGHKLGAGARACPSCGAPTEFARVRARNWAAKLIFVVLVVALVVRVGVRHLL